MIGDSNVVSCLMLAVNMHTPVDIGVLFKDEELYGSGVETYPHITVFFGGNEYIPDDKVIPFLNSVCPNELRRVEEMCKDEKWFGDSLLENFYVSNFKSNTNDVLVLKLKKDNKLFEDLSVINNLLTKKYGKQSEHEYVPHITLSYLQKGESDKYINNDGIYNVLIDSLVKPDDLVVGYTNHENEDTIVHVTSYNAVDRYFRLFNQEEDRKTVENMCKSTKTRKKLF